MKIAVCGAGAQGSITARRLDEEAGVTALVCTDYDEKAAKWLIGSLASEDASERRVDVVVVPADPV